MKKSILISAFAVAFLGFAQFAQPVFAAEDNKDTKTSETKEVEGTFAISTDNSDDLVTARFGRNLLVAGNNVIDKSTVQGLLFSFGNQMGVQSSAEYTFVAGNIIDFSGTTKRDLFIAGNSITLSESAKIGRDTFVAGNTVAVNVDLPGDFSAGAAKVTFDDVKIDGNVNLDVAEVSFTGSVEIAGQLIINDDAVISDLHNAKYASLEKYENVKYEATATEILISKILSIAGLFVTMVIVLALFARTDTKIDREMTAVQFGKDLVIGFCALVFIPIISVFLMMSFFAAPAGIVLLAIYLIMLYLAQGFAGFWIGKLIIKKILRSKGNRFLEALLGITILSFVTMLPSFGWTISFAAEVLGLGLILQSINPSRKQNPNILTQDSQPTEKETITEAEVVESEPEVKKSNKTAKTSKPIKTADSAIPDDKTGKTNDSESPKGSESDSDESTAQEEE